MNLPWFKQDPSLFAYEEESMREKGFFFKNEELEKYERVVFEGRLDLDGETFEVKFLYPYSYPTERPYVYLPSVNLTAEDQHRTLIDGALCLRSYMPDQWDSLDRGVDLIPDIKRWIRSHKTGNWKNEHHAIDEMLFSFLPNYSVLINKGLNNVNYPDYGKGILIKNKNLPNIFLLNELPEKGLIGKESLPLFNEDLQQKCNFFCLNNPPIELARAFSELKNGMPISTFCSKIDALVNSSIKGRTFNIICPAHKTNSQQWDFIGLNYSIQGKKIWQFFALTPGIKTKRQIFPIATNFIENLYNRIKNNLNLEILFKIKVAIIGLGAIGSTVAMELASAGIRDFILFDPDSISIGNICRHECDISYIGKRKVDALEEKILLKNPFAKIQPIACSILTQEANFEELISSVDIVCVCVGNHNIQNFINNKCLKYKKSAVYSFVGPDATAGRIYKIIPEKKGCYKCIETYVKKHPKIYYKLPEIKDINSLPMDYGCNSPAITGTSFDHKTISLAQAKLVIQIALGEDPPENIFFLTNKKIDEVEGSDFLWCKKWIIPKWSYCPECGSGFSTTDYNILKQWFEL